MSYQTRERVDKPEHTPELQWLEDGVNLLAATTAKCACTILTGLFEILSNKPPKS